MYVSYPSRTGRNLFIACPVASSPSVQPSPPLHFPSLLFPLAGFEAISALSKQQAQLTAADHDILWALYTQDEAALQASLLVHERAATCYACIALSLPALRVSQRRNTLEPFPSHLPLTRPPTDPARGCGEAQRPESDANIDAGAGAGPARSGGEAQGRRGERAGADQRHPRGAEGHCGVESGGA